MVVINRGRSFHNGAKMVKVSWRSQKDESAEKHNTTHCGGKWKKEALEQTRTYTKENTNEW